MDQSREAHHSTRPLHSPEGLTPGHHSASEAGGRVGVCPGLYDDPHRRSLTSGDHSSSRLAPSDPYPSRPGDEPHGWCLRIQVGPIATTDRSADHARACSC
jgi:hypothetical protein